LWCLFFYREIFFWVLLCFGWKWFKLWNLLLHTGHPFVMVFGLRHGNYKSAVHCKTISLRAAENLITALQCQNKIYSSGFVVMSNRYWTKKRFKNRMKNRGILWRQRRDDKVKNIHKYTAIPNFGFSLPKHTGKQLLRKFRVQKIYPKLRIFEPNFGFSNRNIGFSNLFSGFQPKLRIFEPKLRVFELNFEFSNWNLGFFNLNSGFSTQNFGFLNRKFVFLKTKVSCF
jgi:hypothetical protein